MTDTILSLAMVFAVGAGVEAQEERETFLYVTSNPPGAEVLVDGEQVGTTPGLFPFKPGKCRVIVDLDGHDQYGEDITIRAGDIKRLTLRMKKRAKAKSHTRPLAPDATLEEILARLKKPPNGWEVIDAKSASGDQLAGGTGENNGRVDHISMISLSKDGKRIGAGVYHGTSGEDLGGIRDEALRTALGFSRFIGSRPHPLACLTYGNTVLTFWTPDEVAPEFLGVALRELGFAEESQVPLWADLRKQHELRKQNRVKLVVGKERMTLEGKRITWDELHDRLEELPDRDNTTLFIARTTDDWVIAAWREAEDRILGAHRNLGFGSVSFIGVHPLGSRATRTLRLVIAAKERMTFDGRDVKQSDLFDAFLKVEERYRTVLEIVRASGESEKMTIQQWNNLHGHAALLANQVGFKSTTYTGEGALGSKAISDDRSVPDESGAKPTSSQLNEALELIAGNYYVGLDRADLMAAAIRGVAAELDEHSGLLSQSELEALREESAQKLTGIGAAVRFDEDSRALLVETPFPNMPACRAGICAGDTIVEIDGKAVSDFPEGKELRTAVVALRGRPGSSVTVKLRHAGFEALREITVVREQLRIPVVKGDRYNPDGTWNFKLDVGRRIGYVRLASFGPQCADELENTLDELKSDQMEAFILDLRNNPGGSLSEAIEVADLFVADGVIVTVKDRQAPQKTWSATNEGTFAELPMAVLVNGDSVAAAEIVAACLQDHARAIIVGERTYGKGTAHKIFEFKGGDGALKLPAAVFLRPNGKGIHRFDGAEDWDTWGVSPDPNCGVSLGEYEDRQLMEYRRQRDVFSPERPPKTDFQDRQLQKAIECLSND